MIPTDEYTTCRFDHNGNCQTHSLRGTTGIDLKCIDGIAEYLDDEGRRMVERYTLEVYMRGHRV